MEYYYNFPAGQKNGSLTVDPQNVAILAAAFPNPLKNISEENENNKFTVTHTSGKTETYTIFDGFYTSRDLAEEITRLAKMTISSKEEVACSITAYQNYFYLAIEDGFTIEFLDNLGVLLGLTGSLNTFSDTYFRFDALMGATHISVLGMGIPIAGDTLFMDYNVPRKRLLTSNLTMTVYYPVINKLQVLSFDRNTRITFFT